MTHGKNRKNVRDIIEATSKVLATKGEEWREEMGLSASVSSGPSLADELSKLVALRDQGAIDADEFQAAKAKLLGSQGRSEADREGSLN